MPGSACGVETEALAALWHGSSVSSSLSGWPCLNTRAVRSQCSPLLRGTSRATPPFLVPRTKLKASCMLDKHFASEIHLVLDSVLLLLPTQYKTGLQMAPTPGLCTGLFFLHGIAFPRLDHTSFCPHVMPVFAQIHLSQKTCPC